ncbi:hypothetical protein [Flavobacterium sp.]|uniref:hypothetical protein n=1 Tax=Flavobacterium sp. TaxID=239 RepID=UPI00262076E2|nr:hypothetical protein [Flavobacterium sp.]MDD3005628.1 hypothetical protein [Flavobacterium sp.]
MQKLIKQAIIYISLIFIVFGCKTPKYNGENEYLNRNIFVPLDKEQEEYFEKLKKNRNTDSIRANTSDFYDIEISSKPNKKVFNLEEKKLFSMEITNFGTNELYLPEWFRNNKDFNDVEMSIEIYKKEKHQYVKYVQKRMNTDIFRQPAINHPKRAVFQTNKGKHILYENIWFDINQKIVDEGSYKAKITIDLSNFGYFKPLETELLFEVKN